MPRGIIHVLVSIVAADALVLEHQDISTRKNHSICIAPQRFHDKVTLLVNTSGSTIQF